MDTPTLWLTGLPLMITIAVMAWAVATARRNVGLVDIFWSLFFFAGASLFALLRGDAGSRALLVLALVSVWSLRLAGYLAGRNLNAPEDHRYQAIRARNQPNFEIKSLYLVFILQAVLAWLVSAPLAVAMGTNGAPGWFGWIGAAIVITGIAFESVADAQLARFKADPANAGRVMDRGLWRYTRHPNYFGEFCVWWGFFVVALGAGGWWTVFSPLVMTILLLRVSGVALLEKDIAERRPAYRDYVARTNAFFPGPPREA